MVTRAANSTWYNWYANDLLARHVDAIARGLSGSIVVDVGCGQSPYRAMLSGFAHYIGLDSPGRPDSGSRPDLMGDALALPLRAFSVDAVVCTEVIEHVVDPAQLLAEAHRVLKSGGSLILSAPFTWHLHDEPHDYFRFTRYGAEYLLQQAGFEMVEAVPVGGLWARVGLTMIAGLNRVNRGPTRILTELPVRLLYVILQTGFELLDRLSFDPREVLAHLVVARRRS